MRQPGLPEQIIDLLADIPPVANQQGRRNATSRRIHAGCNAIGTILTQHAKPDSQGQRCGWCPHVAYFDDIATGDDPANTRLQRIVARAVKKTRRRWVDAGTHPKITAHNRRQHVRPHRQPDKMSGQNAPSLVCSLHPHPHAQPVILPTIKPFDDPIKAGRRTCRKRCRRAGELPAGRRQPGKPPHGADHHHLPTPGHAAPGQNSGKHCRTGYQHKLWQTRVRHARGQHHTRYQRGNIEQNSAFRDQGNDGFPSPFKGPLLRMPPVSTRPHDGASPRPDRLATRP